MIAGARFWIVVLLALPLSCTAETGGLAETVDEDAQPDTALVDDSVVTVDSAVEEIATDSTVADTTVADTTVTDTAVADTAVADTKPPVDTTPIDTGPEVLMCPAGSSDCSGTCRDLQADPANCGTCGAPKCASGSMCASGACACQPGLTSCGSVCVDTKGSVEACGGCGAMRRCDKNDRCVDGACVGAGGSSCPSTRPDECPASDGRKSCFNTKRDPMHCGGCGMDKRCTSDEVCVDGGCEKYVVGVGCTTCPCAACTTLLMGSRCCPAPPGSAAGRVFCVDAADCPAWLP